MKNLILIMLFFVMSVQARFIYLTVDGNDSNDGLSLATGKATWKGCDAIYAASDTVKICGDFTITEPCSVTFNGGLTASPTPNTPLVIWGCDASGNLRSIVHDTVTNITAASNINHLFYLPINADNVIFNSIGFICNGTITNGILSANVDGLEQVFFHNCNFNGATAALLNIRTNAVWHYIRCKFENSPRGLYTLSPTKTISYFKNCIFKNITIEAINEGNFSAYASNHIVEGCVFTRCGIGIYMANTGPTWVLNNNTFFKCATAVYAPSTNTITGNNNIFAYSTTRVFYTNNGDPDKFKGFYNNAYYGNASIIDMGDGTAPGVDNILTSPGWSEADTAAATENLNLPSGSPYINMGVKKWSY